MTLISRRILLAKRPLGVPRPDDFAFDSVASPALAAGEFRVSNLILSMDPAIRGFLDDRKSYLPPVPLGDPVRGMILGTVVESRHPGYPPGTYVRALAAWEEFSVLQEDALALEAFSPHEAVAVEHYMGMLGSAGLTAWVGLHEIGQMQPGQTVLVSAAAGAVGNVAGQIAALKGCRAVGLVGSPEKARRILDIGFHAAIEYRKHKDLAAAVAAACPDGVDLFFDNVGGPILEAVLPLMKVHGHVVVCGLINDYNHQEAPYAVKTLWQLVVNRLTMRGFLTYEHPEQLPRAHAELSAWAKSGQLKSLDNIHEGLDAAPAAFIALMSGSTIGKTLVRLKPAKLSR